MKLATHANFVFDEAMTTEAATDAVLEWLRRRCENPIAEPDLEAHRREMTARVSGRSLLRIAAEGHIALNRLRSVPVLLKHLRFCKFQIGSVAVSVDVFNAGNELGLSDEFPRNIVEVFFAAGRDIDLFVDVIGDLFEALPARHVFGGVSSFADQYVAAALRGRIPPTAKPWEFLWPLTGIVREATPGLAGLPVHRLVSNQRGALIQTFADLWTGNEDDYAVAAKALGRRSLWEI